ncbi:MAG: O-antigen ligase family protein [Blastocatellia bacterium]
MNVLKRSQNKESVSPSGEGAVSVSAESFGLPVIQNAGKYGFAFGAMYLFSLLLYLRPNELFPEVFGTLPIIKVVAILSLVTYAIGKLSNGESLTILPIEVKMILALVTLCILLMPVALSPSESWESFNDTFSKVVVIFILMTNLIDTRKRLLSIFNLVIAGGVWIAYFAVKNFMAGTVMVAGGGLTRIVGVGGGMFGNPNDLASALDMLIPLAFVLGLSRKGIARWVYFACVAIFVVSVFVTYSRGAFLGLIASGGFMAWKLGRGKRIKMVFVSLLVVGLAAAASPGGFGKRMLTIFNSDDDHTGSSYQRSELLKRGIMLVMARPFGVGLSNYHILSINEERAHNGYIEISVELGVLGLLAYLLINFAPLLRLWRFEKEFRDGTTEHDKEAFYISVGLQAVLISYIVCSAFSSIQYFWYLYYPVAQSIGFCRIYANKQTAQSESLALVPVQSKVTTKVTTKNKAGVLWKPHQAGQLWRAATGMVGRRVSKRVKVA